MIHLTNYQIISTIVSVHILICAKKTYTFSKCLEEAKAASTDDDFVEMQMAKKKWYQISNKYSVEEKDKKRKAMLDVKSRFDGIAAVFGEARATRILTLMITVMNLLGCSYVHDIYWLFRKNKTSFE